MFMHRRVWLCLLVAVASCSGGGGRSAVVPVSAPSNTGANANARTSESVNAGAVATSATTQLIVKQRSTTIPSHQPASPTTRSIGVSIDGATPVVFNFVSTSHRCSITTGSLVCTINLKTPIGTDTFAITAYDGLDGRGNKLSAGSLTTPVTTRQKTPVTVSLDGAVNSVMLALDRTTPPAGTAATLNLTVAAQDSDGDTIVGPGAYADVNGDPVTIALADSDTSGATTLPTTSVSAPSLPIAIAYTGAALANATFSASAGGFAASAFTNATLTPIPQTSGPALTVDAASSRHAIDPNIYGITWFYNGGGSDAAFAAFAKEIRLSVSRHGGDGTSRYNWQVDSSNAGQDWYFTAGNGQAHGTAIPSASVDTMIAANKATGTKQVLTIPTIEYINNDSPWHCGFPVSLYPNQQSYNPYVPYGGGQCGNGYSAAGTQLLGNTPTSSDILNDPAIQAAWVQHLVGRFGNAKSGGVAVYEMDNEPTGWQYMHRDIHPLNTTCEEIASQDKLYAAAVKKSDPTALVLAPDDLPVADVFGCEGTTNGQYFISQMASYAATSGVRILDYYSAHYPSCCGGDPVANTVNHIHLHQGWITSLYPGTKLAYDEWNAGGPTDFATALVHGDSLGIFGREGVNLASFWGFSQPTDPTAYVWRMYRNYDGAGSAFGNTAISAQSADTLKLTVYAAQRSTDQSVTMIVINKTTAPITSALTLANHAPQPAHVYQYAAANPTAIAHLTDIAPIGGSFIATYPAWSITEIVVP